MYPHFKQCSIPTIIFVALFVAAPILSASIADTCGQASVPCYRFNGNGPFSVPYSFFSFLKDDSRSITVDSLKNHPEHFSFTRFSSPIPVIGFTPYSCWIQFKAENPGNEPVRACALFADAGVDEITFFHLLPETVVSCTTGTRRHFASRNVEGLDFAFSCVFPPRGVSTIYLRCKATSAMELPFEVMDEKSFYRKEHTDRFASGIVYGILCFFCLAALYLSFIYHDANFRNFAIFMLHFCTMLAMRDGIFFMYVWPALPAIQSVAYDYFFVGSLIGGILFCIYFFKADRLYPRVAKVGHVLVAVYVSALAVSVAGSPRGAEPILNGLSLVTILYLMVIVFLTFRHHDKASRFCFFVWFGFFLAITARIVVFSLAIPAPPEVIGILHVGYHYHIGLIVTATLTSIAISFRLRQIEKDRHAALLETATLQRKTLELKLSTLQARVQPHFLFNSLNTIANSIVVDPPGAEYAIVELSEFYRMSLRHASRTVTRLAEEIDLIQRYLTLEKMKFGKRLVFSFAIDQRSRDVLLPSMSLQIFVENSLKHGIHPKIEGGSIHVSSIISGDTCIITVDDTGAGIRKHPSDSGTGLDNLRSRLELVYHGRYALAIIDKKTLMPSEGTGVKTVLEIPLKCEMTDIPDPI